jgi:hypothetical protein
MNNTTTNPQTARFLRTLRVATQSAIVRHDLVHGGREWRSGATFLALAAKGPGEWRFPAEGLLSADGLVLATLLRDGENETALVLQAQGAAGLSQYMNLAVRLVLNSGREIAGVFDRDGRFEARLGSVEIDENDLVGFTIETGGERS